MRKCIKEKRKAQTKEVRRSERNGYQIYIPGKSDFEKPFDPFTDKLDPMLIEPDKQEYMLMY